MAKIASLVLLVLTVAAASFLAPTDAAGAIGFAVRMTKYLKKLKEPVQISLDIVKTIIEIRDMDDGVPPRRGNDAAAGMLQAAVPVTTVKAGGMSFPVAGVDVTSTVTWTSRCGGEAVPCGDPLCEQQDKMLLLGTNTETTTSFSTGKALSYACRPNAAAGGEDYAVIGLGRGNTILPDASPLFSYIIDGDLQGSTVWLSHDLFLADRDTAARAGRRATTSLVGLDTDRRFYYVGIAGVKVGSGEVGGGKALGIMTTTIPFTFLKPAIFNHLEQKLSAVVSPVSASGSNAGSFGQLCYPSGTELPAITLVFDGKDAGMELRPEHYSYKMSSGVVCLSILPSPWTSSGVSVSVIGSMVQAGRRMTYKLKDNTLTFDIAAPSASSNPSPSLSSSSSVAQAKLTPFFLFVLLLLAIIM